MVAGKQDTGKQEEARQLCKRSVADAISAVRVVLILFSLCLLVSHILHVSRVFFNFHVFPEFQCLFRGFCRLIGFSHCFLIFVHIGYASARACGICVSNARGRVSKRNSASRSCVFNARGRASKRKSWQLRGAPGSSGNSTHRSTRQNFANKFEAFIKYSVC